jgi:hypothetical protein
MAGVPKIQHGYGASSQTEQGDIKAKWWKEDKDSYKSIFSIVKRIKSHQAYRDNLHLLYAQLYSDAEIMGLRPGQYSRVANFDAFRLNRVTLNVIKSCIDTAAATIATAKTRPIFLTQGGNWGKKQQAKKLTKFMDGWFDHSKAYLKGQRMFVDAAVFGLGGLKMFKHEGKVCLERVLPSEIVVDDAEGMYGEPRQLHQIKYFHKDVLAEMFPKHGVLIQQASSPIQAEISKEVSADMVEVIESWHLPSGKNAKDGKHVISIENCELFSETWEKDYFPFIFYRWDEALLGFDGKGICEQLIGIQLEINKILRTIQKAQHLVSVPQVWLEQQNMQLMQKLSNEIGGKYYYTGQPPVFATPSAMSPEVYNHLENLYQKAFEIIGISQLSSTQKKPAGIDSGVALRTLQDVESKRFSLAVERYEDVYMQMADMSVDMMNDLVEEGHNPEVSVENKKFIESIKWKSVAMDKEDYIMRKFPTAALPADPAGRMATVQEWIQAGMVDREDGMELLDFPDTEKMISIKTAAKQIAEMMIDNIMETGDYTPPEPQMNLELTAAMAQNAYLRYRMEGAPEDRLELLETFRQDCMSMMGTSEPNAQAGAQMTEQPMMDPAMAMDPLAVPEAPPVSDLLPVGAM